MGDHAKPTANCAGEILTATDEFIDGIWPEDSESEALNLAGWANNGATRASEGSTTAYQLAAFTSTDTSGQAFEMLVQKFSSDASKLIHNHEELTKFAGWMTRVSTAISTAKTAIAAACDGHEAIHNAPTIKRALGRDSSTLETKLAKAVTGSPTGYTQEEKDADKKRAQEAAATARRAMEAEISLAEMAINILETTGKLPDVTATADEIKKAAGSGEDPGLHPASFNNEAIDRALQGNPAPAAAIRDTGNEDRPTINPTLPGTPVDGSPEATQGGTPAENVGSGGTGTPQLPPSVFAAPAAPSPLSEGMDPTTGTGMDPSAMAATPASMMSGMPTSASPSSGTPASGMGAQQPQSAGASPMSSGSGANPLVDSLGQLADSATGDGKGDGDKLTPERLEELLKEAGLTDKDGDGKGLDLDGDGKPDHNSTPDGKHAPTGPAATDLYGSANTNPGLNNPAPPAHLASPSPAMPSTTATPSPSTLAVPMTELSHDVNPVGAGTNGPSGNPPAAGNPSPNTAAAAAGGSPGVLGAYPTGAAPGGPMMGPMTPMAPMGGMGAMGAMGGAPAGSASPAPIVAAAVPPAVAEPPSSGRSHPAPPPPRVSALPPEHALAEMHLASLVRVYTDAGWAGTTIAVGVVDDGSGAPRYVMATSDGLSLVPMGVAVPAGLEVLGVWAANDLGFHRDWGGYRRAGRKLIAWTDSRPQLRLS